MYRPLQRSHEMTATLGVKQSLKNVRYKRQSDVQRVGVMSWTWVRTPPPIWGGGLQAKFWIFFSGAAKNIYFWGDLPLLGGPESSGISSGG